MKHEFLVHLHVQGAKRRINIMHFYGPKCLSRTPLDCITNNEKAKKVPLVEKSLGPPELAQVCYCSLLLLVHQLN